MIISSNSKNKTDATVPCRNISLTDVEVVWDADNKARQQKKKVCGVIMTQPG